MPRPAAPNKTTSRRGGIAPVTIKVSQAKRIAATSAMPPPRGVGVACEDRSFGWSSTAARCNSGISPRVPRQAIRPAAAMIAASSTGAGIGGYSIIRFWLKYLTRHPRGSGGPGAAAQRLPLDSRFRGNDDLIGSNTALGLVLMRLLGARLVRTRLVGRLRLAAERPAHGGAARAGRAAQHDLLGFAQFAGAEIDAFAKTHFRTRRAQPPHRAARQPQQGAAAILGKRGVDRGMQVKAQRERRAGAAGQLVFAAQIVAVRGQVQLARIGHAEARAIPVMGGR